ncbi:CPXCG motif-containing cysteine-rich protein [Shewanella avicenniae]|uniref:CPXCG motif-containing cysteine-rich protein n=1 Tax=Shewanella avicenniae TaxID=2814294 RepID=A0ABX7QXF5_9GAMM|nr:CPXCG motif-containing cysteine-rich protein [Shewanella avicenniae]QSX35330.1 CPXCG motif-containing cysteine-rich protein [Shewanella avicenniae]
MKRQTICCPYCGHHQAVELDTSQGDQEFYNDCHICCNPIHVTMHIDHQHQTIKLHVDADDEQYY